MLNQDEINNWEDLVPKTLTRSARFFFYEQETIESLRWYFIAADNYFATNLEEVREFFVSVLKSQGLGVTDALAADLLKGRAEHIFNSKTHQYSIGHMTFTHVVDNFETYLKDLLAEVVLKTPQILKSKEKEQLDFILSFDDMKDLQNAIASKRIEELFFKGINDVKEYFESRLGIDLFVNQEISDTAFMLSKYRNLIVHNRGEVNKTFLKDVPNSNHKEGDLISFDWSNISAYNLFYQRIIVRLDSIVAKKFGLEVFPNGPGNN